MTTPNETSWHHLVALSAPAYAVADPAPPYGFTTRLMARLVADARRRDLMERTGLRALLASLAILLLTAGLSFGLHHQDRADIEPGLGGIIQAANLPLS